MDQTIALMGMVISAQPIGEHDKRVVILTRERGKISAFARGARRQNSPLLAGTNPFAFGQFHVYEGRSSYTLVQTEISNYFRELAGDVEGACYGFYFLELAEYYSQENAEALEMLRLLYQTFRALMKPALDRALIRRIFELKMLVINGDYPDMFHCCLCHKEQNLVMYSAVRGGAVCHTCAPKVADGITIGGSTVYTMQYIICSPIEKLYTFRVTEQVLGELSMVMNRHFDRYVDKKFKTLDILQMMVENIK